MAVGFKSLRGRFLFVSLLLLAALFSSALYTQHLVGHVSARSLSLVAEQQRLAEALKHLKNSLQATESSIYQYAFLLEEPLKARVVANLSAVRDEAQVLSEMLRAQQVIRLQGVSGELNALLKRLHAEGTQFLDLLAKVESRYPAVPILVSHLNPTDAAFMGAVQLGLSEGGDEAGDRNKVAATFRALRLNWMQMINAGRVVMVSRSGAFGIPDDGIRQFQFNRGLYADAIDRDLARLKSIDEAGGLDISQSEAVQSMIDAKAHFDEYYAKAVAIYLSDHWRADVPFLRDRIRPLLNQAWESVYLLEGRISEQAAENLRGALGTADTLSKLIWLFFALIAAAELLAYWAFELAIRRPLTEVARALEAEGRGASFVPSIRVRTVETNLLLEAFSGMREQIRSRQVRLQSILDDAAEGIITIDEQGRIEVFNNAAQRLFGYTAAEVVGQNVALLMPQPFSDEHDHHLARYRDSGERRIIGRAREVEGRRKDGALFPISLKVSEMTVEGRRLFSAMVEDISERQAMVDHLRRLAEHDTLTGAFNRQYFLAELERAVERAKRARGTHCALLYMDLDNFKYVNDTLGHLAGDRVLVEVTEKLRSRLRKGDLLARLGGDEFALLLYEVEEEGAMIAAEGFRQLLADYLFHFEGKAVDVGCSIGVALLAGEVVDRETLMSRADLACHHAKRGGRNRVHLHRAADDADVTAMAADMGWSVRIRAALEQDRFLFARQPIIDTRSGRTVAHELLLRLRDDRGGLIMPAGFLSSAHRFGLATAIDRWVVAHAVALLAAHLPHEPDLRFCVNLSAHAVGDESVLEAIEAALAEHAVAPSRLCFEITETTAMANIAAAVAFLERLRELGCETALDDFGAGYSSFAYLKELPVDLIKIDGSFVRDIDKNELNRAMVKAMVEIARVTGRRSLAEQVEDERALEVLKGIGIDCVQGFHLGRPEVVGDPALFTPAAAPAR